LGENVHLTTTQKVIVDFLRDAERPVSPLEISKTLKIPLDPVKHYLIDLIEKGVVIRPFRGHYTLYTVRRSRPPESVYEPVRRVHNVKVVLMVPRDVGVAKRDASIQVGDVRVVAQVVPRTRTVVGHVGCKDGFESPREIELAIEVFRRLVESMTGWLPPRDEMGFKSAEFIFDYERVRVDAPFCVTYQTFAGEILRVYSRGHGGGRYVRAEFKARPRNGSALLAFLSRETQPYSVQVRLQRVERKLDELVRAQKFVNELVYRIWRGRRGSRGGRSGA